jgi:tetratricopeptide (TPR) repeat protein
VSGRAALVSSGQVIQLFVIVIALGLAACGGRRQTDANGAGAQTGANASGTNDAAAGAQGAGLDAEIERLERHAERSPSDDVRASLAAAYVKRGDALRVANNLRAALDDYQSALRNDPDNEDAQRGVAELKPQVEGEKEGEYGEPEPLPITPNVTSGEPAPSPSPTPTPHSR